MKALKALQQPTPSVQLRRWEHSGPSRLYPESAHDTFEIALIVEGHVRYGVGSRTIDAGPGDVVIVPAQVGHVTTLRSAMTAHVMHLGTERLAGLSEATELEMPADPFMHREGNRLKTLAGLLRSEVACTLAGRDLTIDALCDALAIEVMRSDCERGPAIDPRVRRAVEFVQDHYAAAIGVEDLARAAAMSRYHFSRCFRDDLGLSPYQYIQHVRVERAKALLAVGEAVGSVAHDVGFRDVSRFARAFRKYTGCTPRQFPQSADTDVLAAPVSNPPVSLAL